MPIVLFTLTLGIVIGYWVCRMQLRGKFIIANDEMSQAVSARLNAEWMAAHPPWPPPTSEPTSTAELPLSQQWDIPFHHRVKECDLPIEPSTRVRKKFPDAPVEYFSAKQVIGGYDDRGFRIEEPQYPGGIKAWNINHGWQREEEK